nr:uncharacterized protein LOC119625324 [Chlorocebus sabaeus]
MPTLKIVFPRSTGWRPEIYISAGRQSWCCTHPIPTRKPFPSRFAALPRDWQTMTLQTVKRPSALPSPVPPETATRSGPSTEFPLPDRQPERSGTEKTQQRPPLLPPQHLPQPAPSFSQPHVTSGPWQNSEDLRRGRASEATARYSHAGRRRCSRTSLFPLRTTLGRQQFPTDEGDCTASVAFVPTYPPPHSRPPARSRTSPAATAADTRPQAGRCVACGSVHRQTR